MELKWKDILHNLCYIFLNVIFSVWININQKIVNQCYQFVFNLYTRLYVIIFNT